MSILLCVYAHTYMCIDGHVNMDMLVYMSIHVFMRRYIMYTCVDLYMCMNMNIHASPSMCEYNASEYTI